MARKNVVRATPPEQDWQAMDDMQTLVRAHEIRKDPKRHKAALGHAKKKLADIRAIQQEQPIVRISKRSQS